MRSALRDWPRHIASSHAQRDAEQPAEQLRDGRLFRGMITNGGMIKKCKRFVLLLRSRTKQQNPKTASNLLHTFGPVLASSLSCFTSQSTCCAHALSTKPTAACFASSRDTTLLSHTTLMADEPGLTKSACHHHHATTAFAQLDAQRRSTNSSPSSSAPRT